MTEILNILERNVISLAVDYWYAIIMLVVFFVSSIFVAATKTKNTKWYRVIEWLAIVCGKAKDKAIETVKKGRKK